MDKYTDKFLNNFNILKNAIVGFEFEIYMKDLSYYKTLELLNQYLSPIKVWGFRQYHSDFKPDSMNFKLEPDMSLGNSGCEIITGPMTYYESKIILNKILRFIRDYAYTTDKTAIHFNISFDKESGIDISDIDILKLILEVDEDEIYNSFPGRKNNVYAKSIKSIVPYKSYDFNNISIDIIKNVIRVPNDKYYGVNLLNVNNIDDSKRIEFRYIGGKDYEKSGNIMYFLDKFIINVYNSINSEYTKNNVDKLEEYLDNNISNFKNLSKYDNFLVEFPSIVIQIDQLGQYDLVNSYYDKIYERLFNIVDSTNDLKDCIINYVTTTQRMEVINGDIKLNMNISNYDFINCNMSNGIFEKCDIINSEVINSQLSNCNISGTNITKSKVLNSNCESSYLKDCFFMNGYFDSEMEGGVFRSGKMGPYAILSSSTKIISEIDNFFNTKLENDEEFSYKDGDKSISFFKNDKI